MEQNFSKDKLIAAFETVKTFTHCTPMLSSALLNTKYNVNAYFKGEHLQKTGSFKPRGAFYSLSQLTKAEKKAGVCTHSSGNHGQALAKAAQIFKLQAFIVMPSNAPHVKVDAVKQYGAKVIFCEPTLSAREQKLKEIQLNTGAIEIHPYNHVNTIVGQSTCTLEMIEQVADLNTILCPIGGGGLVSGALLVKKYFKPQLQIIGIEPEGANDAYRSFHSGQLVSQSTTDTIADGLLTNLGSRTWPIIKDGLDDLITVSDPEIRQGMKDIFQFTKQVVEPSGAVSTAGLKKLAPTLKKQKVGVILCGGNVDLNKLGLLLSSSPNN